MRWSRVVLNTNPARVVGEGGEQCVGVGVEVDAVASFGFGGGQHGAVGAFDPAGAERDPHRVVVDVVPPQRQQLCASCAGGRGQHQQHVQHRVAISDVSQQCVELDRGRRMEFSGCDRDAVGSFGGVVPHPSPSHRVGECRSDHDMHPRQRARCEWATVQPTAQAKCDICRRSAMLSFRRRGVIRGVGAGNGQGPSGSGGSWSAPTTPDAIANHASSSSDIVDFAPIVLVDRTSATNAARARSASARLPCTVALR